MAREVNKGQSAITRNDAPKRYASSTRNDFDWSVYLGRNEKLLWQGRPEGFPKLNLIDVLTSAFGLIFLFSGLFAIGVGLITPKDASPIAILIGLTHFGIGFYIAFGRHLLEIYRLKNTNYAITEGRALIHYRNSLKVINLKGATNFKVRHHGDKATFIFSQYQKKSMISPYWSFNILGYSKNSTQLPREVGFRNIIEGKVVYDLLTEQISKQNNIDHNEMEVSK